MRPIQLNGHHKTQEKLRRLKKDAEQDGAYRVAKRIHGILLNMGGKTTGEISDVLEISRSNIHVWLTNYEVYGIDGLLEGQRCGRPSRISINQKEHLCGIIDSGPVAYGFATGVWTSSMIAAVIYEEFSIHYHPGHVRKLLYGLGFSVQRPRKKLILADEQLKNKWRRETFPNLKKKPIVKALPSSLKTK